MARRKRSTSNQRKSLPPQNTGSGGVPSFAESFPGLTGSPHGKRLRYRTVDDIPLSSGRLSAALEAH